LNEVGGNQPVKFKEDVDMAQPKKIGNIVADLVARRGYARVISSNTCGQVWLQVVGGAFAKFTRPGQVRRGVLEVTVANSLMMQELTFQKANLVAKLSELLPDEPINDLRFRVGQVE
jgi:predicted nucleic acid-binding Zn ribbon protein